MICSVTCLTPFVAGMGYPSPSPLFHPASLMLFDHLPEVAGCLGVCRQLLSTPCKTDLTDIILWKHAADFGVCSYCQRHIHILPNLAGRLNRRHNSPPLSGVQNEN